MQAAGAAPGAERAQAVPGGCPRQPADGETLDGWGLWGISFHVTPRGLLAGLAIELLQPIPTTASCGTVSPHATFPPFHLPFHPLFHLLLIASPSVPLH